MQSPAPSPAIKQPIVPQSITDRNGQILSLLRNTIKSLDWTECGYNRFFYLFQVPEGKTAFCLFCGTCFKNDLSKLGEHAYECSSPSSPLFPFRKWLHEGQDVEENALVLSLLRKSLFLHFCSAHYCTNLMSLSSKIRIPDHTKTILHLLGVPCPNWETGPNPLTSLNPPLTRSVWSSLKPSKGVFVIPHCLHDKYDKPEGLLVLVLDLLGSLYAVARIPYQKDSPVDVQIQDGTFSALQSLEKEGIPVLGFIATGEDCSAECMAQLQARHPETAELAELVELAPARRFKEDWTSEISHNAELRALAEPVLKVVDVLASTPLYASTMNMAARSNKIDDLVLYRREELDEEGFYEKWLACGVSFFTYMSVFKNMQAYMKRNKARFREPNPQGFDFFTSVEIRPNTRAFAAARDTLRLPIVHQVIMQKWRQQDPRKGLSFAQLAERELGVLQLPPGLIATLTECFTRETASETWGLVPVKQDMMELLHYICYQGERGFASAPDESTKNALRALIPTVKARRKAVLKEFEEFSASFTELAELGFGKLPPTVFWEGEGMKRYPRFGKIALRLSLIPSKLDVTKSVSILRTYASKQFKSFYGEPDRLEKAQNVINMFSVDYYSLYDEENHRF